MKHRIDPTWLKGLLILAIGLGIGFRFIHLDRKIYWHDEVYTSMRAAGFTRQEIDNELFQNQFFAAPELQKFQQIKPGSTAADTITSLKTEDPQHPPLYFLMARAWIQQFGSSMVASRLLPVLLSLLGLPLMYRLAMEVFASPLAAWLASALLALSPFDVLFAQTVRQYSLLTVAVIGSSWLLLRAIRLSQWQAWAGYAVSVAIGLYTHPFFALTVVGHGVYVLLISLLSKDTTPAVDGERSPQTLSAALLPWSLQWRLPLAFLSANAIALVLYGPWIAVLLGNYQRATATTSWATATVGLPYLAKLWALSFTALFIDIDFGFENPFTYILRSPYLLLILVAGYIVYRRTPKAAGLFVLTSVLVPFLLLAIPDLVLGGKRSAVSRYLISCYPGIQLAVAYLLAVGLSRGRQLWQWILAILVTSSLVSLGVSAQAESWWNKDLSYFNAVVSHAINQEAQQAPVVLLSDRGDDYTNTGDLISLSYELDESVRLFLVSRPPDLNPLVNETTGSTTVLTFRPSEVLKAAIEQQGWQLQPVYEPGRLWRVKK